MTNRVSVWPKLGRMLPYLALGPITGPLVAGVVRHRRKAPALAALYAMAAAETWFLLPILAAEMTALALR